MCVLYLLLIINDNRLFIVHGWEMYEIGLPSISLIGLNHQNDAISKEHAVWVKII